ncbi:formate dehydrogenase subunit alpha [uncultured Thermanaerothrix sp.]|uniref:formate dehydrogenase subunit alpha n=1 Tax=uncultured Thermanaerothrix sp. TaxID=1195149 RepID=UPI002630E182|nr:formate dehydrogenase subunit alpha [uncultured Thermanaerothrix sp.]
MVTVTIDGKKIEVPEGMTVLEAAAQAGITIPTLCYHKDLSPHGGCRLCVVEVKGARTPLASCTLPVNDGMEVTTESPALHESRRTILQLLLSTYHDAGYAANDGRVNELEHWARVHGLDPSETMAKAPRYPINSDPNPFVWVDLNKCILCGRCIRACAEVQGRFVWGLAERGYDTRIVAGMDETMLEARCESCGACVAYCPTGALDNKPSVGAGAPDKVVTTTCSYCGVGCQFDLQVNTKENRILRVTSNPEAPVNGMHLCVKGRYGYDYVHHPDRLLKPRVREYLLKGQKRPANGDRGPWVEVDWDTALEIVARKLVEARDTYGPDSVGILTSAKCTNEENYLMNKLARQVIGTNNIDHCARLCHSSTVAGLALAYGSGAMSNSMKDVAEKAAVIFITGSNTTEQHPVFGAMIRQAVLKRGAKLIVADPRRIDITEFATLHLQQRPGTDIALINGLMYIIVQNGWQDQAFIAERTENYEAFLENLQEYTPERVSAITGVPVEQLYQAAEIMGKNRPMAVIWAMGITQHIVGVQNVLTLANLQMLLGNMGVPGGGVNPLRGQNNVQGACDVGGLPDVYPGYQKVTSEEARLKFEQAWGVPLPDKVGLTVTEMIPAAGEGKIKAMYILGENPVMSDPDSNHVRHCLQTLEFLALQEIFPSETSVYADVLLPGVSFAEKDGTFTNTERRIQRVRQAIQPLGEARQDWMIIQDLAQRILSRGKRRVNLEAPYAQWNYTNTAQIMDEIAALTPIYAGVTHARLEAGESLQWPVRSKEHPGTPILHVEQFTRGKGKFHPTVHIPPAEQPDETYPMVLTTGRVLYHWHGGEMTRRSKGLMEVYGQPLIEINPEDAQRIGLNGNRMVRVSSRRGSIIAEAWITERVPPGLIYGNFHFPEASVNELTLAALDPISKIPEFKVAAVRVEAYSE